MSACDLLSAKVEQIIDLTEAMTVLDSQCGDDRLVARLSYLAHELATQLPPLVKAAVLSCTGQADAEGGAA